MPSPEEETTLAGQRHALRDLLEGRLEGPLTFPLHEAFCMDAVVAPTLADRLRMLCRYAAVWLGGRVPSCPLKVFFYRLAGAKIGRNVCISPGVILDPLFPSLIEIEDGACLGMGCRLVTHEYTASSFRAGRVKVGSGSVIGGWSTVRSGVVIGRKATVGLHSFVNRNVPDGETVAGVPARAVTPRREGS